MQAVQFFKQKYVLFVAPTIRLGNHGNALVALEYLDELKTTSGNIISKQLRVCHII